MKRAMTLLVALALLLGLAVPALAEAPKCLVPTQMMARFNSHLPEAFKMMGTGDDALGATLSRYGLNMPELASDGMRFSNEDGTVLMVARGGSGFSPVEPADDLTLSIASSVSAVDAMALKLAFFAAMSELDGSVTYEELVEWMPEASAQTGSLSLNGYTLLYSSNGEGQQLTLMTGDSSEVPAGTEAPAPALVGELPDCFIPQTAAQYFNGMLGPMLEMLGAPNPGDIAERFELTKAQIDGSVLYLTNAEGTLEMDAYFEDGQPAVDKQATTLGIAMAESLDRSEMLSIGATFSYMVMELDDSVTDFEPMLDWMSGAVDGGGSAIMPLDGYMLVYAKPESGYIFTLVPGTPREGGQDAGAPVEAEPEATPEPTAEPTPEPTAEPASQSLEGAVLDWNGLSIQPIKYRITAYRSDYVTMNLYFRVKNTTDQKLHVDVDSVVIDGNSEMRGTSIATAEAHSDSGTITHNQSLITSNTASGQQAIADARQVTLEVVLKDEHFNRLYTQAVTLNLDALEGERDVPEGFAASAAATRTPTPAPTPTQAPKVSDSGKSESSYHKLAKGDKGDDVKRLQQKLIDLGYLNDVADGEYGPKTAAAVKAFNEANGLGSHTSASAETQKKLFSGSAKGYTEPWIPVDIPSTQWQNIDGDGANYRVKITNTSKTRTIKGIALQYYVTDVWGERPWGSTIYREFTNTDTIKPGKSVNSMWWYMTPSWHNIDMIHFRVAKVAFEDGEVHENYDGDFNWTVTLH